MLRRLILILLACTAVLPASAVQAARLNVSLLLSDGSGPYQEFVASLNKTIAASRADVNIGQSSIAGGNDIDLVIAVGMKAAEQAITQADRPVLVAMVPDAGYRELLDQFSPQRINRVVSVIYLNQPWHRRLAFLRAALPGRQKIGLLYSPDTHIDIEALRREVSIRGGKLVAQPVPSEDQLFPVLDSVLSGSDVLLAIPDKAIYSSNNIRNILLTSYRREVPLIGIAKTYVNAGALCAIFSTPEQLGDQAGQAVLSYLRGKHLPATQYPAEFTIEVNQQVARSLGIELPSQEKIRDQMDRTGERDQ